MDKKIKLLKALGDETRIKIVRCLMDKEQCACSTVPFIGKAQSTISSHLKILEDAGVVESRREGINIWYKVSSKEAIQILKILNIKKIRCKTSC